MFYANVDGEKKPAESNLSGFCPCCGAEVIPKCGEIKTWHWSHKSKDCDPWSEGMTQWHLDWQERFPKECREVTIERDGVVHRADVRLSNGLVIEFQHSPISPQEMREREEFYGNMIWVFDARKYQLVNITDSYIKVNRIKSDEIKTETRIFEWKHPHKSRLRAEKPVFLDFKGEIYNLFSYSDDIKPLEIACIINKYDNFLIQCADGREYSRIDKPLLNYHRTINIGEIVIKFWEYNNISIHELNSLIREELAWDVMHTLNNDKLLVDKICVGGKYKLFYLDCILHYLSTHFTTIDLMEYMLEDVKIEYLNKCLDNICTPAEVENLVFMSGASFRYVMCTKLYSVHKYHAKLMCEIVMENINRGITDKDKIFNDVKLAVTSLEIVKGAY